MKRSFMSILFMLIILFMNFTNLRLNAATYVKGGIFSNTTWTKAESPYIITDTVVVFNDITLTIKPGVIIKFNDGKCMQIRGTINAIGTPEDSIIITSSSDSPSKGIWKGFYFEMSTKATFNYCVFSYAELLLNMEYAYQGNYNLKYSHCYENNNVLNKTGIGTSTPNMVVDGCLFDFNKKVVTYQASDIIFKNSIFRNNQIVIEEIYESEITNCIFTDNILYALGATAGKIENNTIKNNGLGIQCWLGPDFIFRYNTIINNDVGIEMWGDSQSYVISNNIICNNKTYNLKNKKNISFNLSDNCWCLSDSASIRAKIYDAYNDISLGIIKFMPFIDDCTIDTSTSVNIIETPLNTQLFEIFPNPAIDFININSNMNNGLIEIYNQFGIKVLETEYNERISVSFLSPGIYFLRANNKFIKFIKI